MPVRLPSYIYRNRCGVFYVRVVAPLALAFERREFRLSLQTTDRANALLFSRYFGHRLAELFANLHAMAKQKKADVDPAIQTTSKHFRAWLQAVRDKYTALERVEELELQRTTEVEQYLKIFGMDGALLHADLSVTCDSGLHSSTLIRSSARARPARSRAKARPRGRAGPRRRS